MLLVSRLYLSKQKVHTQCNLRKNVFVKQLSYEALMLSIRRNQLSKMKRTVKILFLVLLADY